MTVVVPTFADVVAAASRIGPHVVRTPVVRSAVIDATTKRQVFFKCENLQHGGAFKFRGALNAVLQLDANRSPVVVTHSSGNHATALALAARLRGFRAVVVMPHDSARTKLEAAQAAGATIELCEPGLAAREKKLAEMLARQPGEVVHPFDDERVIAGQGTAALELLSERPMLDAICAPVGGGGLIGGTALAAKAMRPGIQVIAAEPAAADDAYRSFTSGVRAPAGLPNTIADGLRGALGERNFQLLRAHGDAVVTVTEAEIVAAMRWVLAQLKLLIEPSAAVAVAAVLAGRVGREGDTVGVILSGGNVDLDRCPFLRGDVI